MPDMLATHELSNIINTAHKLCPFFAFCNIKERMVCKGKYHSCFVQQKITLNLLDAILPSINTILEDFIEHRDIKTVVNHCLNLKLKKFKELMGLGS